MEQVVKLNSQTAGRDKVARLLQYLSRVLWHKLQQGGKPGVDTLKNLEYQLSSFRKLLRFGKCIDVIYSTLPLLNCKDPTVKVTVILGKLSTSIFLVADHILWLGRSELCPVNTDKWSKICSQYWLYSIVFALLRDLYEILRILRLHKDQILPPRGINNIPDILRISHKAVSYIQNYPNVVVDVIKNTSDIFLPLVALGYLKLSPGTVGTLGTISSLAGLIVLLTPKCKLSP